MRVLLVAVALVLTAGCSTTTTPTDASPSTPPRLGGTLRTTTAPPGHKMTMIERVVAEQLSDKLDDQALSVDYLDCPHVDGQTPRPMTCRGFVDGVVADVRVRLLGPRGDMHFDARLGKGVLATQNLVHHLAVEGYHRIDCGDRDAYPAVVGSKIVCSVTRHGRQKYVSATVTTDTGQVEISDY